MRRLSREADYREANYLAEESREANYLAEESLEADLEADYLEADYLEAAYSRRTRVSHTQHPR